MHLCLAKANFGLVPFLVEFAVGGAAKARPGLIAGLIAAIRLPDAAYCSSVSPAHFARNVGVENVYPHCAKPGEFHTARAHVFLVSVAY